MITIIFFLLVSTCVYNFIIGSFLEKVKKRKKLKRQIVWRGYKLLKVPNINIWIRKYFGLGGAGERENQRRIRYNHFLARMKAKLKRQERREQKAYDDKMKRERWWRWLLWGR